MMHKYTDLEVYRVALDFTVAVRRTVREFPREERSTLGDQLTRATDSMVLNVAEGAGCDTNAEFARFLTYAIRSGFECKACLDIAEANGLCSEEVLQDLRGTAERIIAMLYGLQKYLRKK
jgi:four helix bundle protein